MPQLPLRFQVDVLRDFPPVYLVHDFATKEECDHMMNATIPHMTPSVVGGGGTSADRPANFARTPTRRESNIKAAKRIKKDL